MLHSILYCIGCYFFLFVGVESVSKCWKFIPSFILKTTRGREREREWNKRHFHNLWLFLFYLKCDRFCCCCRGCCHWRRVIAAHSAHTTHNLCLINTFGLDSLCRRSVFFFHSSLSDTVVIGCASSFVDRCRTGTFTFSNQAPNQLTWIYDADETVPNRFPLLFIYFNGFLNGVLCVFFLSLLTNDLSMIMSIDQFQNKK